MSLSYDLESDRAKVAMPSSAWGRWWIRPQSLWARKALFQIHLWTGIGLGLYILVMSVTGTALIYRRELTARFSREPVVVVPTSAVRLTDDQLKQAAASAHPGYKVTRIFTRRNPALPVEILLENGDKKLPRLFNPFTGSDIGPALTMGFRFMAWLADLHDNLLYGRTGRLLNCVGGIFTTLLCITGIVIWWPGIEDWRASLGTQWKNRKGFNWTLHSVVGLWSILFVFMWGITGVYLSIPVSFNNLVDFLEPMDPKSFKVRFGDQVLFYAAQLHFGRYGGWKMELSWAIIGIVPAVLFVTGTIMWWRRVLNPWLKRGLGARPEIHPSEISPRDSSIRA